MKKAIDKKAIDKKAIDQKVFDLYDDYAHNRLDRQKIP